jgi:hypothetical protein
MKHDFTALSLAGATLLIALASFAPTPAAAQGTPDERAACSGDAQRLCGQFIPDATKTGACLARMRASLSPACKVFFTSKKSSRRSSHKHRHHR